MYRVFTARDKKQTGILTYRPRIDELVNGLVAVTRGTVPPGHDTDGVRRSTVATTITEIRVRMS